MTVIHVICCTQRISPGRVDPLVMISGILAYSTAADKSHTGCMGYAGGRVVFVNAELHTLAADAQIIAEMDLEK